MNPAVHVLFCCAVRPFVEAITTGHPYVHVAYVDVAYVGEAYVGKCGIFGPILTPLHKKFFFEKCRNQTKIATFKEFELYA